MTRLPTVIAGALLLLTAGCITPDATVSQHIAYQGGSYIVVNEHYSPSDPAVFAGSHVDQRRRVYQIMLGGQYREIGVWEVADNRFGVYDESERELLQGVLAKADEGGNFLTHDGKNVADAKLAAEIVTGLDVEDVTAPGVLIFPPEEEVETYDLVLPGDGSELDCSVADPPAGCDAAALETSGSDCSADPSLPGCDAYLPEPAGGCTEGALDEPGCGEAETETGGVIIDPPDPVTTAESDCCEASSTFGAGIGESRGD